VFVFVSLFGGGGVTGAAGLVSYGASGVGASGVGAGASGVLVGYNILLLEPIGGAGPYK